MLTILLAYRVFSLSSTSSLSSGPADARCPVWSAIRAQINQSLSQQPWLVAIFVLVCNIASVTLSIRNANETIKRLDKVVFGGPCSRRPPRAADRTP